MDAAAKAPPDHRGHRHAAVVHLRRVRNARLRRRRGRHLAAPELPDLAGRRRIPGGLGARVRPRPDGARRPRAGRGARAPRRPDVPRRDAHRPARLEPDGAPDPRVVRAPAELDRVLGSEISLAGGSFLQPRMLGKLRYGSALVDPRRRRHERGRQRAPSAGTTRAFPRASGRSSIAGSSSTTSRAARPPLPSAGRRPARCAPRAGTGRPSSAWSTSRSSRAPRARSTTSSRDTDDGVSSRPTRAGASTTCASTSSSRARSRGRSSTASATRILRDPFYTGITPRFWRSCDAVCSAATTGASGASRRAAKETRCRSCTSATAPRRRASATSRSGAPAS